MNSKMKAIMNLINDMDEDILKKVSLGDKMEEKPDVKITKVSLIPKEKMEEKEDETEEKEDNEKLSSLIPESDENEEDPIVRLKKKFSKV